MLFTDPVDFREALESRAVKAALPTMLKSRELEAMDPALREWSKFSAQVTRLDFIEKFDALAGKILQPKRVERKAADGSTQTVTEGMDFATARLELKNFLRSIQYRPEEGKAGTIEDLSSDKRLNLILEMNVKQAQGYGYWKQAQDPAILSQWPASELYRAEDRKEKRDWAGVIWLSAAAEVGDDSAARSLRMHGVMAARQDSAIWTHLGPFKVPYAPFDWGSGMDRKDVRRGRAVDLGVVKAGDVVKPQDRKLNDLLQASPNVRSEGLRKAVLDDLGDGYEFDGDVLKRKAASEPSQPINQPQRAQRAQSSGGEEKEAAKSRPEPSRPARKTKAENPVSAALQIVRRNPRPLEEFRQVVDLVHDDGKLPRLRVDGQPGRGMNGCFRIYSDGTLGEMSVLDRRGDVFTFAHETGHFLDHQALGFKGAFASIAHADLQAFREAARSSAAVRALEAGQKAGESGFNFRYFLHPQEIFARAYAQWMTEQITARELGSPALRSSLSGDLQRRLGMPYQAGQWTAEDFREIAAALERLFEKKGWLIE